MKTSNALLALILALFGIGAVTIGMTQGNSATQQPSGAEKNDERRGSIKWFVKRAKEQKKTKVFVPPPLDSYAVVTGLDEAASQYTVVVAQPLEQKTAVINDSDIITWHKLQVIEVVSYPSRGCAQCASFKAPEGMSLKVGEIVVPTYGGTLLVDGVQLESRQKDFGEHFSLSRKYLIFLSLDPATSVGKLSLGPYGVFTLSPSDKIIPIVQGKSPISQDLELKFENSLSRTTDYLRNRTNQ